MRLAPILCVCCVSIYVSVSVCECLRQNVCPYLCVCGSLYVCEGACDSVSSICTSANLLVATATDNSSYFEALHSTDQHSAPHELLNRFTPNFRKYWVFQKNSYSSGNFQTGSQLHVTLNT